MAVRSSRVTVAATATAIAGAYGDCSALIVKNIGSVDVYLGGSDVTSGTGFPLSAGATAVWDLSNPGVGLYGIVASGTCVVAVLGVTS